MTFTLIRDIENRLRDRTSGFLKKGTVVAGVDPGSESTKAAIVTAEDGKPVLLNLIHQDGPVSDETATLIKDSAPVRVCGLSGHDIRTYSFELPRLPKKELEILVTRNVEKKFNKDPIVVFETHSIESDKLRVRAVASASSVLEDAISALGRRGIAVNGAFADVSALWECTKFVHPEIMESVVCVCNIGTLWSELIVIERGSLIFSRSIRLGMSDIIGRVSDLCGISREQSREMVFSKGIDTSIPPGDVEENLVERTYSECVREVIEQLTVEIQRSISFASVKYDVPAPERMYISGGGAAIPGMQEILQGETGMGITLLNPLKALHPPDGSIPVAKGCLFSVVIGLALLGLKPRTQLLTLSKRETKKRTADRLLSAVIATSILLILVLAGRATLDSTRADYARAVETESLILESLREDLEAAGDPGIAPDTPEYTFSLLSEPAPVWSDVLKELSNTVPEGVLFDEISLFRRPEEMGQLPTWEVAGGGVVIDMESTAELLRQMRKTAENSRIFSDIKLLPQGSTVFNLGSRKINGAIRFEFGANLE